MLVGVVQRAFHNAIGSSHLFQILKYNLEPFLQLASQAILLSPPSPLHLGLRGRLQAVPIRAPKAQRPRLVESATGLERVAFQQSCNSG